MKLILLPLCFLQLCLACRSGSTSVQRNPPSSVEEPSVQSLDSLSSQATEINVSSYASIPPCTESLDLSLVRVGPSSRKFRGALRGPETTCTQGEKTSDIQIPENEFNEMVKILLSIKLNESCLQGPKPSGGSQTIMLKHNSKVLRYFDASCVDKNSSDEMRAFEKFQTWIREKGTALADL